MCSDFPRVCFLVCDCRASLNTTESCDHWLLLYLPSEIIKSQTQSPQLMLWCVWYVWIGECWSRWCSPPLTLFYTVLYFHLLFSWVSFPVSSLLSSLFSLLLSLPLILISTFFLLLLTPVSSSFPPLSLLPWLPSVWRHSISLHHSSHDVL